MKRKKLEQSELNYRDATGRRLVDSLTGKDFNVLEEKYMFSNFVPFLPIIVVAGVGYVIYRGNKYFKPADSKSVQTSENIQTSVDDPKNDKIKYIALGLGVAFVAFMIYKRYND